jgi:hypothetical protein
MRPCEGSAITAACAPDSWTETGDRHPPQWPLPDDAAPVTMATACRSMENEMEQPSTTDKPSHCLLCGQVGPVVLYGHWICDHCKNVVQAEALARKRKIEKEGGR